MYAWEPTCDLTKAPDPCVCTIVKFEKTVDFVRLKYFWGLTDEDFPLPYNRLKLTSTWKLLFEHDRVAFIPTDNILEELRKQIAGMDIHNYDRVPPPHFLKAFSPQAPDATWPYRLVWLDIKGKPLAIAHGTDRMEASVTPFLDLPPVQLPVHPYLMVYNAGPKLLAPFGEYWPFKYPHDDVLQSCKSVWSIWLGWKSQWILPYHLHLKVPVDLTLVGPDEAAMPPQQEADSSEEALSD